MRSERSKQNTFKKGLIHLQKTLTAIFILCTLCTSIFTAGCNSQGTEIEMNRATPTHTVRDGGKGSRTHCSHDRGLEMNTQILMTSIWNISHSCTTAAALCVHVHMWRVCNHVVDVVGGYVGEQISFELLIWNKVAQEASRAVILFPNVHEHL